MAWNPKKWFGRGKPEQAAPPAAAPHGEKKPGRLRRLATKLNPKKPKPEVTPPPEAPPAAPSAPSAPAAPATAPPVPAPAAEGPAEGDAGGGEAPAERTYPSSIDVQADGDWIISSTEWSGLMKGTIVGHKAKKFIDAYENGDWNTCAEMVADVWDANVASQIVTESSTIDYINWR